MSRRISPSYKSGRARPFESSSLACTAITLKISSSATNSLSASPCNPLHFNPRPQKTRPNEKTVRRSSERQALRIQKIKRQEFKYPSSRILLSLSFRRPIVFNKISQVQKHQLDSQMLSFRMKDNQRIQIFRKKMSANKVLSDKEVGSRVSSCNGRVVSLCCRCAFLKLSRQQQTDILEHLIDFNHSFPEDLRNGRSTRIRLP